MKTPQKRKRVNLALQGGGAHGAFTWGVLDAFLCDDRLEIAAVSGTSAGAMNAIILADGLHKGGAPRACAQLREFWRAVSIDGKLSNDERNFFGAFFDMTAMWKLSAELAANAGAYFSPYQTNPLNINPLRTIVEGMIDFPAVRSSNHLKLFISATNVRTGKIRIFRRPEMTADVLMASACLPTLFQAVEIGGDYYWDGGYMGNPALFPFFTETDVDDIVLVQINPIERPELPRTAHAIVNRLNEITFNSSLLQEFRAIDFVARLVDAGRLDGTHYKKMRLHLVEGGAALAAYGADTKIEADFGFFERLFALGKQAGENFLTANFEAIGAQSTYDPKADLN